MSQLEPGGSQSLLWCDMASYKRRGKAPTLHNTPGMNKASASDYAFWYCPETICSSFEEFSGYADVSVLVKPAVMVWKRTELPPGMQHVFFFFFFLNLSIILHLHHRGGTNVFRLTLRFKTQEFNMNWTEYFYQHMDKNENIMNYKSQVYYQLVQLW